MAVTRAQKMRLGLFVAVGLTVLLGSLLVLAGLKLGEKRESYVIRFGDADVTLSGLEVGSPVKYSGIRVGRVETIKVASDDVSVIEVAITLDQGTPVAEDSLANLGSQGITGLKYIELTRGSKTARVREPGEAIPPGKSLIDDLASQAGDIAGQVSEVLDRVKALTGPDMKDRVASVLDRTDKLLETLDVTITENRTALRSVMDQIQVTTAKVDTLVESLNGTAERTNRLLEQGTPRVIRLADEAVSLVSTLKDSATKLERSLATMEPLVQDARKALGPDGLQKTMGKLDGLIDKTQLVIVQSRENFVESLAALKETTENLSIFSQKVRDDPSLLLMGEGGDPK